MSENRPKSFQHSGVNTQWCNVSIMNRTKPGVKANWKTQAAIQSGRPQLNSRCFKQKDDLLAVKKGKLISTFAVVQVIWFIEVYNAVKLWHRWKTVRENARNSARQQTRSRSNRKTSLELNTIGFGTTCTEGMIKHGALFLNDPCVIIRV